MMTETHSISGPDPARVLRAAAANHRRQHAELDEREQRARACPDPARRGIMLRSVALDRSVLDDSSKALQRAVQRASAGRDGMEVRDGA